MNLLKINIYASKKIKNKLKASLKTISKGDVEVRLCNSDINRYILYLEVSKFIL